MKTPPSLEALVDALRVLPGVGPRSALRMAYHLLQRDQAGAARLSVALSEALTRLTHCVQCNTLAQSSCCPLCSDPSRDETLLCVVEMPIDVVHMEQTLAYKGRYFVLMGRLSPLDGIGPGEVNFDKLLIRACDGKVKEVVLSTNFTIEGETTAEFLVGLLQNQGLLVSRIARGLPVGGELEHVDGATLAQALRERRQYAAPPLERSP